MYHADDDILETIFEEVCVQCVYSVCKVCDLIDLIHLLLHLLAFFLPPPFHNTSSSRISDNQLSLKWIAPLFHTT